MGAINLKIFLQNLMYKVWQRNDNLVKIIRADLLELNIILLVICQYVICQRIMTKPDFVLLNLSFFQYNKWWPYGKLMQLPYLNDMKTYVEASF